MCGGGYMHVSTVLPGETCQISLEFKLWQLWAMDARKERHVLWKNSMHSNPLRSSPSPLPLVRDSVQHGALMECLDSHYIFNFLFFEIIVQSNLLSLPFLFSKPSHICVLFFSCLWPLFSLIVTCMCELINVYAPLNTKVQPFLSMSG